MKSVICWSCAGSRGRGAGERLAGLAVRVLREPAGAVEPELGHVGALAQPLVAAAWLAERLVRSGHVEDVIDDLEEHAQLAGKVFELFDCRRSLPTLDQQHAFDAGADQAAGLELVHVPQALGARGRRGGDVEVLAADHAVDAGRGGELGRGAHDVGRLAGLRASAGAGRPRRRARRRPGSRRPRRRRRGRSGARGAGRRRPSPAGRRGSASRCGSARAPRPAAARSSGSIPIAEAVASASTGRIRLPPASSE